MNGKIQRPIIRIKFVIVDEKIGSEITKYQKGFQIPGGNSKLTAIRKGNSRGYLLL